jgi:hypothetical protein
MKIDLENKKYDRQSLKSMIFAVKRGDILKTQFLDVTFVVRYILNEKYRIYKDDDINICDICKYQPHILMSDLEKEMNNYDSDDDSVDDFESFANKN